MSVVGARLDAAATATQPRRPAVPRARAAIGAWWMGASAAMLIAGCSPPGEESPARQTAPATAWAGASRSADPGTGSAEHPFQAQCAGAARSRDAAPGGRADFGVGPIRYASAGLWATMSPPGDVETPDGRYFYKTGAILRPGAEVTVTIAPAARRSAKIDVQGGPDSGSTSVTYHACPAAPDTAWPGGFLLTEPTACLPLDVRVLGEPRGRLVVLSVFHHACPTPR